MTTDPISAVPEPPLDPAAERELAAILADPDMWEPVAAGDEAAILAAIGDLRADRASGSTDVAEPVDVIHQAQPVSDANVVPLRRRWIAPFIAGAAAAALTFGAISVLSDDDARVGSEVALAGTELAPAASGSVEVVGTPNGTVLLLDVSGLPPAADGTYYEAWLRQDAEVGVSAGTFHLRGAGAAGSSAQIELWAGVSIDDYPLFTVTIQEEADSESSGRVVLRGQVDDSDS